MTRITWNLFACLALGSLACVPDLQTAVPRCTPWSVSYPDAPESFKTAAVEDAIGQYEALAGLWSGSIVCPPDGHSARTLDFAIQARPRSEVKFLRGCGSEQALANCEISLSGPAFPELDGQSTSFSVGFLSWPYKVFGVQSLDATRDPSFYGISMVVAVDMTNTVSARLTYAFRPQRNPDGTWSEEGYQCSWDALQKVGT